MARFEEAENRMFNVKICLKCNARKTLNIILYKTIFRYSYERR